jgi:hypothetical protein
VLQNFIKDQKRENLEASKHCRTGQRCCGIYASITKSSFKAILSLQSSAKPDHPNKLIILYKPRRLNLQIASNSMFNDSIISFIDFSTILGGTNHSNVIQIKKNQHLSDIAHSCTELLLFFGSHRPLN